MSKLTVRASDFDSYEEFSKWYRTTIGDKEEGVIEQQYRLMVDLGELSYAKRDTKRPVVAKHEYKMDWVQYHSRVYKVEPYEGYPEFQTQYEVAQAMLADYHDFGFFFVHEDKESIPLFYVTCKDVNITKHLELACRLLMDLNDLPQYRYTNIVETNTMQVTFMCKASALLKLCAAVVIADKKLYEEMMTW